ncbi:flavin-containing monooxygenase-related family protein [Populus alba x Populus x berolinensis]|uniref:Flavin-containing monooxygenase n=1 Tax=Populus alba x Populus x berolinensis TaxID=444605 RepID=A0AAD6WFX2_9ROSI|nr:flavin-containing monooxygenase-related family protein [Populus alba x Populus x berolinensis]
MKHLSMPPPQLPPPISRHVAVIGAGAAGLVSARELRREGHDVVVFERDNQVGGTWVYNPQVEPDPLSLDPNRRIIHSSLYSSLRTNLPREVMGFKDYPFIAKNDKKRDQRRFPGHREVVLYLQDFASEFGIEEMVRFDTEVAHVGPVEDNIGKWIVRSKRKISDDDREVSFGFDVDEEIYDAAVICNGHYTEPRIAQIPGISSWPGKQMHSHNYRTHEGFQDQVAILIGSSSSSVDISREIAGVAKEVHVTSRSVADETYQEQPGYDNMWLHSMIESVHDDGSVIFRNGRVVVADIILHCTGYKYHFPFLDTNGIVTVDGNRVGPLYKQVFPPALAPWLSFVGLPLKAVPFPLFELQSKWIAGVLSGHIALPSPEEMMEDVKAFYETLEASNIPKHYTHNLAGCQFEYDNWLASPCSCPGIEEWRRQMYDAASKSKRLRPEIYRDEWDDDDLVLEAYADFTKYTRKS